MTINDRNYCSKNSSIFAIFVAVARFCCHFDFSREKIGEFEGKQIETLCLAKTSFKVTK